MRRNALLTCIIAAVVAGTAAACHHHGLDNALAARLVERLPFLEGLTRLSVLQHTAYAVASLLAAWFCLTLTGWARRAGFLLGLVFLILTLWPVLAWQGVFFEPFISMGATLLAGGTAMLMDAGSHRRSVMASVFAGRLSRAEFGRWWRQQGGAPKAGRHQATALTCRLLNETALLRELEPELWGDLMNRGRRLLGDFFVGAGGYLEEAGPGRLRAWFGFPNADETHALSAASAALEAVRRLPEWEQELERLCGKRPRFGLALTSGEMLAASLAEGAQTVWRLSGPAAELGDKLALENARFGSRLLASSATHQKAADGLEVRPLDLLPQGDSGTLSEVYEVLALKHGLSEDQAVARDAFWQGVILLRKGDTEGARRQFERAEMAGVEDAPLAYFKAKLKG